MNSELLEALEDIKSGKTIGLPTNDGNALIIRKVGINKYRLSDKLGTKKETHLHYKQLKELFEKFNGLYTPQRLN